jgi:Tfp pilus assembly protein FimT
LKKDSKDKGSGIQVKRFISIIRLNFKTLNPSSSRNESGFTLLEVIIVLLLSLLILGIVMVSFAGLLSSAKLQATVREFSATLRQARDLAKIHGEQQGWTVDLDSGEYGIEGRKVKKIPSNLDFKIVDSVNGEIRSGQYRLVFEPNGGMEGATFQLSDKKKVFGIELDPLLGAVVTR